MWCSIDNDDSRDLDQLTVALPTDADGTQRILVAIADVDELEVERGVGLRLPHDLDRPLAEVAALGVVDPDGRQRRFGRYG